MTDFNGFDKDVIGKKLPSDSTLNNMKKADLIKLLHTAEHNHSTLACFYKNACDNSKCNRCPLSLNYNKAIDDFVNAVKTKFPDDRCGIMNIEIIATQLKAGGTDGTSTTNN